MSRCLSVRSLWRLAESDGAAAERVHLLVCLRCASRYERLGRDLATIGRALQSAPAALPARRPALAARPLQVVAAVALAAVVVLAGIEAWRARAPHSPATLRPGLGDVLPFLGEVSAALAPGRGPALGSVPGAGDAAWLGEEGRPGLLLSTSPAVDSLFSWDPVADGDSDSESVPDADM